MDMPLYAGDPLSPGWASEKGARKLPLSEADTLMKIPVLPISYADAQPLLANLEGPVAPEPWRGALPVTYHIGPGPATAHLKVDNDSETRPAIQRHRDDSRIGIAGRMGNLRQSSRCMGQWRPRSGQRRGRRARDGADAIRASEDRLETKADHQVRAYGMRKSSA